MAETDKWLLAAVFDPKAIEGKSDVELVLGSSYANTLATRTKIALELERKHRYRQAVHLLREVCDARKALLGKDHPHTLKSASRLAVVLFYQGEFGEAEAVGRKSLEGMEGVLGWDSEVTVATANNLANTLGFQRKFDEAEALLQRVIDCYKDRKGPNHPNTKLFEANLESILREKALGEKTALPTRPPLPERQQRNAETELVVEKIVERYYEKSLQDSGTVMDKCVLREYPKIYAHLLAGRRNRIEVGQPGLDVILTLEKMDLPICSICASLNPWCRETAGGFSQRIIAGIPEFVRKVHASAIAASASENGCFNCQLISTGLKSYSQQYYSTSDGWKDREVKILIKGKPFQAIMSVGARKTERVQFFVLPGEEGPCAAIGPATYVRPDAHGALNGVAQLLQQCVSSHPECGVNKPVKLPTRVIDVGTSNDKLKLVETNGSKGTYITLSYCWGETGDSASTNRSNIQERLKRLAASSLCRTHRDAIEITRSLGVKYLWVDAICIIQDDSNDWGKEIVQMADIYSSSVLTISAAQSKDAQGGILLDRPAETASFHMLTFATPTDDPDQPAERNILYRRPITNHKVWSNCVTQQAYEVTPYDLEYLPLENRAWCLQERILSRRIIHFAQHEFFWECQVSRRCECGEIGGIIGFDDAPTIREDFTNAIKSSDIEKGSHFWMSIVMECTRRGIKYPKDRLPALWGIAQRLQQAGFGEYLAGIWRSGLPEQVLWSVNQFEDGRRAQAPYAPSWSWASIENSGFSFPLDPSTRKRRLHSVLEDVRCAPSADATGNFSGGYLRLRGPKLRFRLFWFPSHHSEYKMRGADLRLNIQMALQLRLPGREHFIGRFRPDFPLLNPKFDDWMAENLSVTTVSINDEKNERQSSDPGPSQSIVPAEEIEVTTLAVLSEGESSGESAHRLICLVLRPVDRSSPHGAFERIGVVCFESVDEWTEIFDLQNVHAIEIV